MIIIRLRSTAPPSPALSASRSSSRSAGATVGTAWSTPSSRRCYRRNQLLQPAAPPEQPDETAQDADHDRDDDPERADGVLAGDADVHAPDRGDERQREEQDAEGGQHPQHVVEAMREDRLVGVLQALDDLLEVLEHVPDALGRVDDVVEVDLEVLGHVAARAVEVAQGGALRADDLAEVDDLLLGVGDVAHDVGRAPLEDVALEVLELVADLAQHRERRVHAAVDDPVEQVARSAGEERLADLLAGPAALEDVLQRVELLVGQRDDVVRTDEDVELGRVQPPDGLVVLREVQDDEQVVLVLVDLRALVAREDVLVVEGMEVEVLLEPDAVDRPRALDVDPAQAVGLDGLDVGG